MPGATHALLDRDEELAEIAALVERARQGEGGVLVFRGPPGLGKTALLDQAAATRRSVLVLRGRGGEIERELSFGLVRELFEPLVRAAPPATRRRWLSGAAAPASAVLGEANAGEADAASVSYGLYWLLAGIAQERPVLLVADDLQWCDPSSLRWLVYLARRIDGLPVGLLGATRPADPDDPAPIEQLVAVDGTRVRRPRPLGAAASGELIARRLGSPPDAAFTAACHAASGGNPLLLRELLEAVGERGLAPDAASAPLVNGLASEALRRTVVARLHRLGPGASRLARAVALLGDGCELGRAAELAGIDPDAAVPALRALVAANLIADSRPLVFEHPLLRTAVYLDVAAPVRAAEHGRAAALLSAAGVDRETVAQQLLAADPVGEPWATAALAEAGEAALARGAPDAAVRYLRRALDERPEPVVRAELVRTLANALVRLGDPGAGSMLGQALELAAGPVARARIVEASVDPLMAGDHAAEARRLLLGALVDADLLDPDSALLLTAQLATVRALSGEGDDEPVRALAHQVGGAGPASPAQRYAAGALALQGVLCGGSAARARTLARRALGDGATLQGDAAAGRPLHLARVALALAGAPGEALRGLDRAVELSRERGSLLGQGSGLGWRALIHLLAGSVGEAENDARESLAMLGDTSLSAPRLGTVAVIVWALLQRNELQEAQLVLDAAPPPHGWGGAAVGCARAQLLLAERRYDEALVELAAVEAEAGRAGWRSSGPLAWRSLAVAAHLGLRDGETARHLAEDELARAETFGCARELGRALRVRALSLGGDEELLGAAVDCLRDADATVELATALIDQGAALRRRGERARAREPLYEGRELAARSGATALADRALVELRAAGARPRRTARSGVESLTPSERRVAALAAAGAGNAEIAQTLFVTVRTVEMHLSSAYRKLAIGSREALTGALAAGAPPAR